jgi:hypothetical protein
MMVALLLSCYATGTRSWRQIMRRGRTDVACRIIVGDDIPAASSAAIVAGVRA